MGDKLPRPCDVVKDSNQFFKSVVDWYGGKKREVELLTNTGNWYRIGKGLVKVRWFFVRDVTGTHRDAYFYSTDVSLSAESIVSLYTSRWAIEPTFQECKAHLKIEKNRVWSMQSVLTLHPMIFACYSLIVLLYLEQKQQTIQLFWSNKVAPTFSDMILSLRKEAWKTMLFSNTPEITYSFNNYSRRQG